MAASVNDREQLLIVDRTLKVLSHGTTNPLLLRWVRGRICTAAWVPLPLASKRFEHFHFLGLVGAFENGTKLRNRNCLQLRTSLLASRPFAMYFSIACGAFLCMSFTAPALLAVFAAFLKATHSRRTSER